jgi:hypothetical protein
MMTLARTDCMEAGRWIVAPSARGHDLGRTLLLSLWVVGQWLDKRCVFGAVGVRDGQSSLVGRCGGQVAPSVTPRFEGPDAFTVWDSGAHHTLERY